MAQALTLFSPRLILRPFEDADMAVLMDYRSDPLVAQYQGWMPPFTSRQAREFLEWARSVRPGQRGEWYQLAITLRDSGAMIGDCGFCVLPEDGQQAEIGFSLARPYQKRGYGTEAIRALLGYLFRELALHRVRAVCDVENTASAALLERVGMRREAHIVEGIWFKGRWSSEYWYAMLAREWGG